MGNFREIYQHAEAAANMYQTHGSGESAASSLDKAAKILESHNPEEALKLYQHAADIAIVCCLLSYWIVFSIIYLSRFKIVPDKLQNMSVNSHESMLKCNSMCTLILI